MLTAAIIGSSKGKRKLTAGFTVYADVPDVAAVAFAAGLRVAWTESPAGAGAVEDAAFERASHFMECTGFGSAFEFRNRVQCHVFCPSIVLFAQEI